MRAPYSLALAAFCLVIAAMARQHLISQDECSGPASAPPKTWWRAEIQHNGTTPYSTDPSYKYYRTVLDYGADNTGANDTSGAFNEAIHGEMHCGVAKATLTPTQRGRELGIPSLPVLRIYTYLREYISSSSPYKYSFTHHSSATPSTHPSSLPTRLSETAP